MTSMTGDEGQKMMTSTYQHSNGSQEQRTRLDALVLQHLSDRVILKPLTRWNEAYKEFPRYVLEYLCARYIDPNDPLPGQKKIDRILQEHYMEIYQSCNLHKTLFWQKIDSCVAKPHNKSRVSR